MKALTLLLTFVCLGLVSCGMLSAEQAATVEAVLVDLRDTNKITPEQYEALLQTLHQAGTWAGLEETLYTVGGAVLASLTGVRIMRGTAAGPAEKAARIKAKGAA